MARTSKQGRPGVEGLEGRQLLSGRGLAHPAAVGTNPLNVRAFAYVAPSGARVTMEVRGAGNLAGTNVGADGGLNLVYGDTNATSIIFVHVSRGTAPLDSVKERDVPLDDFTGVGGQLLGSLLAPQLDLVGGGRINMTSGVNRIQLHSVGAGTAIHLRDLPVTSLANLSNGSGSGTSGGSIASGSNANLVAGLGAGGSGTGTSGSTGTTGTTGSGTTGTTGSGTTGTGTTGTGTTGTGTSGTGTTGSGNTGSGTTGSTGSGTTPVTVTAFTGGITASGGTTGTVIQGTFGTTAGTSVSTLTSTAAATGATAVVTTTLVIGGNNQTVTIPPGEQAVNPSTTIPATAPSSFSFAGRTLTYSNNATTGGSTLTGTSGTFTPTLNLISTPNPANPGPNPQPPGILIQLGTVRGAGGSISGGSIFGYDPKINGLVRFDAFTGSAIQIIPVGGTPTNVAGVGLGRDNGLEVVLLARGTTVQVFDATSGGPIGTFSAANLASIGLTKITGVAYNGSATVLTSPDPLKANVGTPTAGNGIAVAVDVAQSLAIGAAVVVGTPFGTDNGFVFAGGATGVTVSNNVHVTGGAPFNTFLPLQLQEGVQTLTGATKGSFRSSGVASFANTNNSTGLTPLFPLGSTGRTTTDAGSVENLIAIDTGVSNGTNTVTLYTPALAPAGTLALADANPIVALSETAHTELAGSALVDVQGNVQTLQATSATGLAANVAGNLDLVQIRKASDSTIVGNPLGHVQIGQRSNVSLVTTSRAVGMRNGVIVAPNLRPLGPLAMPV